jgi:nicotinate phosphoribosyltransferase
MQRSYKPTNNIVEALETLFPLEICPWDDYYARMAQSDFFLNRHQLQASKTFFIRKAPFKGSFAILGGLTSFLRTISQFTFNKITCEAMKDQGYSETFIAYLQHLGKIKVNVYAPPEGSLFFPNEPAIIMEGDLVSIRLAEGALLKHVNFPSLIMTKWRRVKNAAAPGKVLEFSRRRAQDDLRASFYAYLGGADITSNSDIRAGVDINVAGTMGHEWIQSFGNEFEAFDKWLEFNPDRPVLLVDTINTLKSGLSNAIKAFKKHWIRIKNAGGIAGIRNDSGDLAFITIEERIELDRNGLNEALIFQTNDLDEYSIENIKSQIFTYSEKAGINPYQILQKIVWACGTNPGTCSDQPSLGGVAKLTSIEVNSEEKAVIKIAYDNPIKTSIPGNNRSCLISDENELLCCLIHNKFEQPIDCLSVFHPDDQTKFMALSQIRGLTIKVRQQLIYEWNKPWQCAETFSSVRERVEVETNSLHWTCKRLQSPHIIKVSLSEKVFNLRKQLISNSKLIED